MKTFKEMVSEKYGQKELNPVEYAPGQDSLINKNVRKRRQDSVAGEATNPYAVGTAQAMKKTGDKPPLKKSTINLSHKIAKAIKNEEKDPCWDGYRQLGMKKKNGKSVPNCVPESVEEIDELSKKTMQSYYAKAQGQLSDISKKKREYSTARTDAIRKGKDPSKIRKPAPTAADHDTFRKRDAGTKVALKKLTKEEVQLDEILSIQGRIKRARDIKKNKAKLKMGKMRQANRIASKERLQDRAKRHARTAIVKRITKGLSKSELSPQRRAEIERRLERMKGRIDVIARKILPQVRKDELLKKRGDKSSPNSPKQAVV